MSSSISFARRNMVNESPSTSPHSQVEESLAALALHRRPTEIAEPITVDDGDLRAPSTALRITRNEPGGVAAHLQSDMHVAARRVAAEGAARQPVSADNHLHNASQPPASGRLTSGIRVTRAHRRRHWSGPLTALCRLERVALNAAIIASTNVWRIFLWRFTAR